LSLSRKNCPSLSWFKRRALPVGIPAAAHHRGIQAGAHPGGSQVEARQAGKPFRGQAVRIRVEGRQEVAGRQGIQAAASWARLEAASPPQQERERRDRAPAHHRARMGVRSSCPAGREWEVLP